jgi:hypothetical protein
MLSAIPAFQSPPDEERVYSFVHHPIRFAERHIPLYRTQNVALPTERASIRLNGDKPFAPSEQGLTPTEFRNFDRVPAPATCKSSDDRNASVRSDRLRFFMRMRGPVVPHPEWRPNRLACEREEKSSITGRWSNLLNELFECRMLFSLWTRGSS